MTVLLNLGLSASLLLHAGVGVVEQPKEAAAPQVLARCESPWVFEGGIRHALSSASPRTDGLPPQAAGSVALIRDAQGLDIRQEDADGVIWSARASGAQLEDVGAAEPLYHVLVRRNQRLEHYLFTVNADHSGQLLWSTASDSLLSDCRAF